jgi:hypothetical protein
VGLIPLISAHLPTPSRLPRPHFPRAAQLGRPRALGGVPTHGARVPVKLARGFFGLWRWRVGLARQELLRHRSVRAGKPNSRHEILAASPFRSNRFHSPVPWLARASAPGQLATGSLGPRPNSSRCHHGHNSHRRIVRFDRRNQHLNRPASAATWNPPAHKGRANFRSALSLALNPIPSVSTEGGLMSVASWKTLPPALWTH